MEEWTDEACLKLIAEYKKQRILWDTNHRSVYEGSYDRRQERLRAWQTIGESLNCDADTCKRKIGAILSSFRRSKSKMLRYLKIASSSKECVDFKGIFRSTWYRFKDLSFMLEKDPEAKELKRLWDEIQLSCPENLPMRRMPIPGPKPQTSSIPKSTVAGDNNSHQITVITPEIKAFSAYIAAKMSKYSEYTKNMVQQRIFQVICNADQAEFHSNTRMDTKKKRKLSSDEDSNVQSTVSFSSNLNKTLTIIPDTVVQDQKTTTTTTTTLNGGNDATKTAVIAPRVTRDNFTYIPSTSRSPSPIDIDTQNNKPNNDMTENNVECCTFKPNIKLRSNVLFPVLKVSSNTTGVILSSSNARTTTITSNPIISNVVSLGVQESYSSDEATETITKNLKLSDTQNNKESFISTKAVKPTNFKIEYESDEDTSIHLANTEQDIDHYDFLVKEEDLTEDGIAIDSDSDAV